MRRLFPIAALLLAVHSLTGCDENKQAVSAEPAPSTRSARREAPARGEAPGKPLLSYAPATDFVGAAPEDVASGASAFFDGSRTHGGLSPLGRMSLGGPGGSANRGKRILLTASASERITDLGGAEPPLPDDYDYSRSGSSPGTARDAGRTLLDFARFQIEQKFPTVAPIMSRRGWRAAPRVGNNEAHTPYRVTVHHTEGKQTMSEAETARVVKNIQHYHMVGRAAEGKTAFEDIGYHFLVSGDGRVIEGRRAEYMGAHAGGANDGNIGIAAMGNFNKIRPTDAQIESLTRLVTYLSIKYKKDPAAQGFLEAHQHYTNTDCPGTNLLAILDALRRKIDRENEIIVSGHPAGEFTPLSVIGA